jgi:GT2 family glycosyltransferase
VPGPSTLEHSASIDVSIVIPAYHGAATIADCLTSVQAATVGRRCEIIVVESSGDGTRQVVRDRFPDVRLVPSETRLTAGGARNRGVAEARGRVVFFVDQDCVVPSDWVGRLEAHLQDPSVGAVGGSVGIRNLSSFSGCAMYFLEFLYHFPGSGPPRRDRTFLVGCNSAYRVESLRAVAYPDQTLGEDVLFSDELLKKGTGVVYDPAIEVRHQNRTGWREFLRYNHEVGRAAAAYHQVLRRRWAVPFLEAPVLVYLAPAFILPSIAVRLARSRWSYFWRFLLLLPMCLVGNLVWAGGFRRHVIETRRSE